MQIIRELLLDYQGTHREVDTIVQRVLTMSYKENKALYAAACNWGIDRDNLVKYDEVLNLVVKEENENDV